MSIEERLEVLEKEVAEIKQILAVNGKPANWLEQVTGSMKTTPILAKFCGSAGRFVKPTGPLTNLIRG